LKFDLSYGMWEKLTWQIGETKSFILWPHFCQYKTAGHSEVGTSEVRLVSWMVVPLLNTFGP